MTDKNAEKAKLRKEKRDKRRSKKNAAKAIWPGMSGGKYKPLSKRDMERIHETALALLEEVGMADPTDEIIELATARGCSLDDLGRLHFPKAFMEDIIAGAGRRFTFHAPNPKWDMDVGGDKVYFCTSGEAINIVDMDTNIYRPSKLQDIYDLARVVDTLDNIHHSCQMVVATDILDPQVHSINAAYACIAASEKSTSVSITRPQDIEPVIAMLDMSLGAEGAFLKRPFVSFGACPVISPLRFAQDSIEVIMAATKLGVKGSLAVASQSGSTAPTALAGSIVQVIAEALACLAVVNMIRPGHALKFGAWPFASDLRTGSFSGGSGEQALLSAATTQMVNDYYDLPSGLGSGMTDSKIPDAQAGFEKGVTVTLAAMAGANTISECAGMLGSLMGCGFDSLVMDNEMLGMINRTLRGIEVTEETLSFEVIKETVLGGSGHYLAHPQTQKLSRSEYYYPEITDRGTSQQWLDAGGKDMRERSKEKAKEILATHYPIYIEPDIDARIREHFPILLPKEAMRPS